MNVLAKRGVFDVFRGSLQHGFRNVWHGGEKTGIRHTSNFAVSNALCERDALKFL